MSSPALAIIKTELRRRRWSTFWWACAISVVIILILAVYPAFRGQSSALDKSLANIPASARDLFTDTSDFLSPVGYLSSQCYYLLIPLLFTFLAVALGSSLLAREEQSRTIELVLARPVSRGRLLFAKASAGLAILLAVGLCAAIISAIMLVVVDFPGVRPLDAFLVSLMALDFGLLFGALAFALTAFGRLGRGAAIGVSVLLALGGYIISSLDKTITWLVWPARFLPFHYYHPADILRGHFTLSEAIGMLIVTVILIILAWLAFRRRDIN